MLVRAISDGPLGRPLLAKVTGFLHDPAMASVSRLAYLLKAFEAALKGTDVPTVPVWVENGTVLSRDFPVRPEGAVYQWRKVPPRELSIALVADERPGRATGLVEAS